MRGRGAQSDPVGARSDHSWTESATRLRARVLRRWRRWRSRDAAAEIDAVAAVTEQIAVLLAAGVSVTNLWDHVTERTRTGAGSSAEDGPASGARSGGFRTDDGAGGRASIVEAAHCAARSGEPVDAAIATAARASSDAPRAWLLLAAAWAVASETGAPLASSLRELAAAFRDEAQLVREVSSALAGAVASTRLVMALPLVAVGFGALMGFDSFGVLFGSPLGIVCLVVGVLLLFAGARWNAALARRAEPSTGSAGLELELLAVAMQGGAALQRARAVVASALARHAPGIAAASAVDEVLRVASSAGAPVAELLRAEASRARRAARSEGLDRATALGVRAMLPLGVCVLPAFVALGVAPLMISVVTATLGAS